MQLRDHRKILYWNQFYSNEIVYKQESKTKNFNSLTFIYHIFDMYRDIQTGVMKLTGNSCFHETFNKITNNFWKASGLKELQQQSSAAVDEGTELLMATYPLTRHRS